MASRRSIQPLSLLKPTSTLLPPRLPHPQTVVLRSTSLYSTSISPSPPPPPPHRTTPPHLTTKTIGRTIKIPTSTTTTAAATATTPIRQFSHSSSPLSQKNNYSSSSSSSSSPPPNPKQYTFQDIQSIITQTRTGTTPPSPSPTHPRTLLIDVREPSELSPPNTTFSATDPSTGGTIPTARNVPWTSAPDAWTLDPHDWELRFGFPKPDPEDQDTALVFFCKAGVRCKSAARAAAGSAGYRNVGEYGGSWVDWVERGGEREKVG